MDDNKRHDQLLLLTAQSVGLLVLNGILETRIAEPEDDQPPQQGAGDRPVLEAIVDAVLEVGGQRKALLDELRSALDADDREHALAVARELTGGRRNHEFGDEKSSRSSARVN